ncbi:GNAT family N-acetyltransferase [Flavobacterium columnare]|uniref:GNAT family N-acetyltransferase n=1 Tax=Flavobacterium columnare TaxID=996 RepID=A0A437UD45_9FLAO|nr:GNAT family N-acetyltransferase [Flavobacterium columnare]RVU91543.1 GNAT family N-acetyltransferase [Flavobacterium columnare]
MRITSNPNSEHLNQIYNWLKDESVKKLNGFYGNFYVIENAFSEKRLICIIDKGLAIGYLVYSIDGKTAHISIANIKHEYKRKGLGLKLLEHLEKTLIKKNVIAIDLKCSPSSSIKIWKKLGFKELKEVEKHRILKDPYLPPYLYKILVENEKPTKAKKISKTYIELFCNDPIKRDASSDYVWKINPKTISHKPIIYPVDSEWNVRFYKNGEVIENRIKRFNRGEFLNGNFIIIDKVP